MRKIGGLISKRAIGLMLIFVSVLVVLGYSAVGNLPSANAIVAFKSQSFNLPQVNLEHVAIGKANLVWDADQQALTVTVVLSGLAPNSQHPMHIHQGSCETSDQKMLYPLNTVMADKVGDGTSVTTIKDIENGIPASGWFINVHNGPDLSTDLQARPIACGDIMNFNTSTSTNQTVNLTLGSTQSNNQAVNRAATLSIENNQLMVTLTVSGLEPGSTHQAHIHQGSCMSQGPVVYPLTPVVADDNGIGTSMTKIANVTSMSGDWYINVHQAATAADLGSQTGFDPLVCGDITPQQPNNFLRFLGFLGSLGL